MRTGKVQEKKHINSTRNRFWWIRTDWGSVWKSKVEEARKMAKPWARGPRGESGFSLLTGAPIPTLSSKPWGPSRPWLNGFRWKYSCQWPLGSRGLYWPRSPAQSCHLENSVSSLDWFPYSPGICSLRRGIISTSGAIWLILNRKLQGDNQHQKASWSGSLQGSD